MGLRIELVETNTNSISDPETEVISFGISNKAVDGLGFRIIGGRTVDILELSSEDREKVSYVIDLFKTMVRINTNIDVSGGS